VNLLEINNVEYEVVKGYDKVINLSLYEEKHLEEIIKWKKQKPSVLSKTINLVSKPIVWAGNKLIPNIAFEGILNFSNLLSVRLTDKEDIRKKAGVKDIEELRYKRLDLSDSLADEIHKWAIKAAVVEGGGTGILGLAGIAIDIPVVITLAFNTINKIGICYGYECKTKDDREFCMAILSASSSNTIEEKAAALGFLKNIEITLTKKSWEAIAIKAAKKRMSKEAGIIAAKNLSKQLGVNLSKRKALAAIPIAGAVVGGSVNGLFLRDVGWSAKRAFQERWLMDNGKIDEEDYYKSILL
jgi:uncharacterized protein YdcH (DUF465 family)